ncbi:MAG: UvrD-helicase domain-containing protein, partial [Actinomycetota bacterium]|nr:UvrD-helicase domain-containing protein [Actinomycetota bacterium]
MLRRLVVRGDRRQARNRHLDVRSGLRSACCRAASAASAAGASTSRSHLVRIVAGVVHARPVPHGRPAGDGRPAEGLLADLTDAQREAVVSDAAPLCVLAGAGSGKTRVLTRRVAHRCLTGDADPAHVLVLTFTRKAAGELSARLSALGLRDRVAAGTFHAVAAAQLRRW